MPELIDTIVRFHDVRRLPELTRCIFSLVSQTYRPLRIILCLQRFSEKDVATTTAALEPFLKGEDAPELEIVNWREPEPEDARSLLLNLGIAATRGKYVGFLDYDDVLYPEAYRVLTRQLRQSSAAIAFAAVRTMRLDVFSQFFYAVAEAVPPYSGSTLLDLFRGNFCPLHSFLIDRSQTGNGILTFNPLMKWEEDYDVLLQVCAAHLSDFSLIKTRIGDYYYKTDGSNTVPTEGGLPHREAERYKVVMAMIEHRRRTTVVSPAVLRSLGLSQFNGLTIQEVLDNAAHAVLAVA